MANWNIPEQKPKASDVVDHTAAQELLMGCFVDEQERFNKQTAELVAEMNAAKETLVRLSAEQDAWWEVVLFKLFKRPSKRVVEIDQTTNKVIEFAKRYTELMKNAPNPNAYEFALYGTKMFKVKG
jgi:hypothetical protein